MIFSAEITPSGVAVWMTCYILKFLLRWFSRPDCMHVRGCSRGERVLSVLSASFSQQDSFSSNYSRGGGVSDTINPNVASHLKRRFTFDFISREMHNRMMHYCAPTNRLIVVPLHPLRASSNRVGICFV